MTPLVRPEFRPEFRPKLWSPADLDAAAGHWLDLCRLASAVDYRDEHRTELRLRGVANAGREAVAAALAARLPGFEVTRPDADTLAAVGPALDFETPPPVGLGVPQLTGPPFDGLYLEVRFMATARKRNGKPHAAGTLVLAGELGPDGFTVYAVWAEGASALANQQAREVPWADEQAWRHDSENFRANAPVLATAATLAKKLFPKRLDWLSRFSAWLCAFPFTGGRRPARFLVKFAANLGTIAVFAGFLWLMPAHDDFDAALGAVVLLFAVTPLVLLLLQLVYGCVMIRRITGAIYATLHAIPYTLVLADSTVAASYFGNPSGRKFGADWEAAGSRSLGEGMHENPQLRHVGFRLLATPDGTVNVLLLAVVRMPSPDGTVRFHLWPPSVVAKVVTRYPDDGTVVTTNEDGAGFRRCLLGPESRLRVYHGVVDPTELLARHAESCRAYAERTGHAPLKAVKFEEFARWDGEKHDQERRLYARNPVTWSDAFVLLMGYVRRAYR